MPLNYYHTGADSGLADADAVQPLENGERVEATILNRPTSNLQNRTEVVRQEVDTLQALLLGTSGLTVGADSDAKLVFYDDSGYKFKVNSTGDKGVASDRGLYVFPIVSVAKKSGNTPIYAQLKLSFSSPGPAELTLVANGLKVSQGAHNIQFRMFSVTDENPSPPVVTIEGAEHPSTPSVDIPYMPVTVAVQIADDGSTTVQAIRNAVVADTPASSLVTASYTGTSVVTADFGPSRLYEQTGSRAGLDPEGVYISAATLDSFFGSSTMEEGSCLVIDLTDAATRRGQTPASSITTSNLAVIKTGHTNLNLGYCDGVIPLAKVFDGVLYLLNGKSFTADAPQYVTHGNLVYAYSGGVPKAIEAEGDVKITGDLVLYDTGDNLKLQFEGATGYLGIGIASDGTNQVKVLGNVLVQGNFSQNSESDTSYLGNLSSHDDAMELHCRASLYPESHSPVFPALGDSSHIWSDLWAKYATLRSNTPYIELYEEDAGTDEKRWKIRTEDGDFKLEAWTATTGSLAMGVINNSGSVDYISFGANVHPNTTSLELGSAAGSVYWGTVNVDVLNIKNTSYHGGDSGVAYTIKGTSGTLARDSSGFISVKVHNGSTYYIPVFADHEGS